MNSSMKALRRPLLFTMTSLLRTVLFVGVPLMGILLYFSSADYLESTLKSSHAYANFVPAITETLSGYDKSGQGIPFNDPGVRQIISNGLPPAVLESSTNQVIDGVYNWLEGKAPEPAFHIDLTKNRDFISENISLYAFNKLTQQPLCAIDPQQVNPFTATCLPSNFSLDQERATFAQTIAQIFPKTVFTAADLPKLANNKSIASTYPQAPTYYRWFRMSPIFFALLVAGLCVAIVKLCRTRRLGFRLLGSVTLSSGVALMITPILYLLAYPHINSALHLQSANTGLNALSTSIISTLSSAFYVFLIKAALIIINLGLVVVLVERFTRSKDYALIAKKSGLVSSNRNRPRASRQLTAAMVPLQSSNDNAKTRRAIKFDRFRKITEKELS